MQLIAAVMFSWTALSSVDLQGEEKQTHPAATQRPCLHAHNDYAHTRPLLDALDHGFCSVEVDVFLNEGELLVGHDRKDLQPEKTLERLYLVPLNERFGARAGRVLNVKDHLFLLIDIKSEGESTYRAIHAQLAAFPELFSSLEKDVWTPRAITAVISGSVPYEAIRKQSVRYAGIDGRPAHLKSALPAHAMPWISENWNTMFRWRGAGAIPPAERAKLKQYVADAHQGGRMVRFWATPENPVLWNELVEQGVDLIGTDDLKKLKDFYNALPPTDHSTNKPKSPTADSKP